MSAPTTTFTNDFDLYTTAAENEVKPTSSLTIRTTNDISTVTTPKPSLTNQWQLRTLKNAYTERQPTKFVVDGLMPLASLSIWYGAPGSLKSMILADCSAAVASGQDWLPKLPGDNSGVTFKVNQCPVLWIDFDNGTRRTDERFDALAKARNLPEDAPLHYVSMPSPWLDASNRGMILELAELIKGLGAGMVVIDNLGLVSGDADEITASMAGVMGNFRWLCEVTNAAIVIIHHQRKGGGNGEGRKGDLLRGHSSIEAALDLALIVERVEGEDVISMTPTKVRGFSRAQTFGALFAYDHKPGSYDLAKATFYAHEIETEKGKERKLIATTIKEAIIKLTDDGDAANKGNVTTRTIELLTPMYGKTKTPGVNVIRGQIDELEKAKEITCTIGRNNASVYKVVVAK